MTRGFYLGFLLLLAVDTVGQVAFKFAGGRTAPVTFDLDWLVRILHEPLVLVIGACYLTAFFTYMTLIRETAIGPVFAAAHLELVTVLIVSVAFLGERLSPMQVAGSLAIVAGVVLLGVSESREARAGAADSAPP